MSTANVPFAATPSRLDRALSSWNAFWFLPSDPLQLCALRVVVGAIALYWAASFSPDLIRFFGPDGLVPVGTLHQLRGSTTLWSVFELAPLRSPAGLWAVHGVCLAVLTLFTLGFLTRVTSVLSLVAVLSYAHRGPMLWTPTEPVLVMLVGYLCVGPCGRYLSVDAWLRRRRQNAIRKSETSASWAATLSVRLIQVHLTLAYGAMAIAKLNDRQFIAAEPGSYHPWWQGEAVWWIAARPYSPLVDLTGLVTNAPLFLNFLTFAVLFFEVAFAIFIWRPSMRPFLLWAAVPIWLFLALIIGYPLFCLLMLAGCLAFIAPTKLQRIVG